MKKLNFKEKKKSFRDSWKPLMHIYRTTKIPWKFLILLGIMSFGTQFLDNQLVPYCSKINTGDMKGAGFLLAYITMSLAYNFLEISFDIVNGLGSIQMARNIRRRLWGKMLRLPISVYENEEPQRFVSRITKDSTYAYRTLSALLQIFSIIYGCYLALRSMAKIYKGLSFVILGSIPVLLLSGFISGKIAYKIEKMLNNAYSKVTNYYAERLPNILYIKTNNMEDIEYENGVKMNKFKCKIDIVYNVLFILQSLIASIGDFFCTVAVLWIASGLVRNGTMEMQQLVSLSGYTGSVMANATMFITVWQTIKAAFGGCEKISLIDATEEERLSGSEIVGKTQEDIFFDHVFYSYSNGKKVLDDVSFVIPKGKTTVIIGENGCGKSTIMKLLERFDEPSSGEIRIGDKKLADANLVEWRDSVGYVFQGNQMILGDVAFNIAYGVNGEYSKEDIYQAAKDADAYDFIMEKDEQFETYINPFDTEFSGGQLQRIAIARVLMKKPEYMIMDEATSGLDVISEDKVLDRVRQIMKNKTMIAITHNMKMIKHADHIVVINEGKVEAEGNFDEISKTSKTFAAFLKTCKTQKEKGEII